MNPTSARRIDLDEAVKYNIHLHVYALQLIVMLLIPFTVALAALQQWYAANFRVGFDIPTVKEIL